MEFLRAGEALLRSSQPLLPFLAPSAHRTARLGAPSRLQYHPSRPLSTTQTRRDDRSPSQQQPNYAKDFSALLDDALKPNKGTPSAPTGRTSRFKTQSAQQANRPSSPSEGEKGSQYELLDLLDFSERRPTQPQKPPRSTPSSNTNASTNSSAFLDIDSLFGPSSSSTTSSNPPTASLEPQSPESPIKLNSTVGRTVRVDDSRGIDVGRAFRMLDMQVSRNSVRKDFQRQRFHERPGLKRKRLRSERWRRRFKEAFRGTIALVQRMKGQGW